MSSTVSLLLSQPMSSSILLRTPPPPSPSPSPNSTPLPALSADLSSSSSSSTSGSCVDLHRTCSLPSTRRIRFAPLPDPRRDELFDPLDDAQPASKPSDESHSSPSLPDAFIVLSPSVSPDSSISSAQSTPTIRLSQSTSSQNRLASSNSKLLRPFYFLRRKHISQNQSPLSQSASLPGSRNTSVSSFNRATSSAPNSPFSQPSKLSRISAEDIITLGAKSLFRSRSASGSGNRPRAPSPPPAELPDATNSLYRAASTGSGAGLKLGSAKRDWGDSSTSQQSHIAGSGAKPRRSSSPTRSLGAGGGRHTSTKNPSSDHRRQSTTPTMGTPKKHVKMLNGRVYGAKRHAAQTLANPFANVRDEPEFVEWGYGGMGSMHASAGIAHDMWKGLQRSERGGALLAGTSFGPPVTSPVVGGVGGGRGHPHPPAVRRKMSVGIPECSMGQLSAGAAVDEDDGSGMAWLKKRRAEKEAKARLEQEAKELEQEKEPRKSNDSVDAGMTASIVSATASLSASLSVVTTDLSTPATSPLCSRSTSVTDLSPKPSPSPKYFEDSAAPPSPACREPLTTSSLPPPTPIDEPEHHILTAVRLSPKLSHKHMHSHGRMPSLSHASKVDESIEKGEAAEELSASPVDAEEIAVSRSSSGDDEGRVDPESDEDQEQERDDDDEDDDYDEEAGEVARKTALGAGVEKISRHVDVEAR